MNIAGPAADPATGHSKTAAIINEIFTPIAVLASYTGSMIAIIESLRALDRRLCGIEPAYALPLRIEVRELLAKAETIRRQPELLPRLGWMQQAKTVVARRVSEFDAEHDKPTTGDLLHLYREAHRTITARLLELTPLNWTGTTPALAPTI